MASTITVQQVLNVAQIYMRNLPLSGLNGIAGEPALTIASTVRAIMLSAPLAWPWNSATASATAVVGNPLVTTAISNYGWLQMAAIAFGGVTTQLTIKNDLSVSSAEQQPEFISVKSIDGTGNVTFRLMGVPDQVYSLTLDYQMAAAPVAALTDKWAPIPDYLSHVYQLGFRAFAYEIAGDPRWQTTMQLFLSQLVGANGGLTEAQANIFMASTLRDIRAQRLAEAGR